MWLEHMEWWLEACEEEKEDMALKHFCTVK